MPDHPLWNSEDDCIRDEVQNTSREILSQHVDRARATFKPGIPDLLTRPAAEHFSEGRNGVVKYIGPDQHMEGPVEGVARSCWDEYAKPISQDGDFYAHGDWSIVNSTQMRALKTSVRCADDTGKASLLKGTHMEEVNECLVVHVPLMNPYTWPSAEVPGHVLVSGEHALRIG